MWQRLAERSQDKAILERANAYPSPESSDGSLSPWSQVMDRGGDGSPGHFDTDGMSELSEPDDWSDIEDDRASEEARRRRAALVMEEQVLRAAEQEQEQWETQYGICSWRSALFTNEKMRIFFHFFILFACSKIKRCFI